MRTSIDVLKDCSDLYSAGENYVITTEDSNILLQDGLSVEPETVVTDKIFDKIYFYLKNMYPEDNFFSEVGAPERGGKVPLEFKMGSMTEMKEGDWNKWKINDSEYVITEKLDGCSLGLTFENGKLKCAQSRGNGIEGADVTRHYINFKKRGFIPEGKIRGEVIIPKKDIQAFIDELETETGKRYKNARNAVAGQLNSKVGAKAFYKYVKFVAYKLVDCPKKPVTVEDQLELIKDSDFDTVKVIGKYKGSELTDNNLIEFVKQTKETSEFECDGIILTLNESDASHEGFEAGTLNPKDSRKFKIGASDNIARTVVKDIIWQISKDYLLKPVVVMDPVELVGVTVTKASAHNYKLMTKMKLGIGSEIIIKRSGDVIPYVEKVLSPSENISLPDGLKDYTYVTGADLCLEDGIKDNPVLNRYYDEANLQKLQYFCNTLKVDKAKYGNIRKMVLYTHSSLRDYSIEQLILEPMESFTNSVGIVGEQIYNSLHSRLLNAEEPVFFDATGTFGRLFGTLKLSKVYDEYGTLNVTRDQLMNLAGFAEISVNQYMNHLDNYKEWMALIESGALKGFINFVKPEMQEITSDKYKDLKVVFTGIRDKDMENKIIAGGGDILNGLSSKCNLLITKNTDSVSSKMQKAQKLGIKIIGYDEAKKQFS